MPAATILSEIMSNILNLNIGAQLHKISLKPEQIKMMEIKFG